MVDVFAQLVVLELELFHAFLESVVVEPYLADRVVDFGDLVVYVDQEVLDSDDSCSWCWYLVPASVAYGGCHGASASSVAAYRCRCAMAWLPSVSAVFAAHASLLNIGHLHSYFDRRVFWYDAGFDEVAGNCHDVAVAGFPNLCVEREFHSHHRIYLRIYEYLSILVLQ